MYLDYSDLTKGAYEETLRVLQREEANSEQAIADAIGEIKPYLSSIYDMDKEFSLVGEQRNKLILKFTRDIAIYNIYCISHPSSMNETRRLKYEDAISFLQKASQQKVIISDLPRLAEPITGGNYSISGGGRTRRSNHY